MMGSLYDAPSTLAAGTTLAGPLPGGPSFAVAPILPHHPLAGNIRYGAASSQMPSGASHFGSAMHLTSPLHGIVAWLWPPRGSSYAVRPWAPLVQCPCIQTPRVSETLGVFGPH